MTRATAWILGLVAAGLCAMPLVAQRWGAPSARAYAVGLGVAGLFTLSAIWLGTWSVGGSSKAFLSATVGGMLTRMALLGLAVWYLAIVKGWPAAALVAGFGIGFAACLPLEMLFFLRLGRAPRSGPLALGLLLSVLLPATAAAGSQEERTQGHHREAVEAPQQALVGEETHAEVLDQKEDDISSEILRDVQDSHTLELPFGIEIHLPEIHLFGLDLSITRHLVMVWTVCLLLLLLFTLPFKRREEVRHGFANLLEMLVLFVRDELAIKNIGPHAGPAFTPYLLTTFFFILFCNLLGLVPYMSTATSNLAVTASLAAIAFLMIQWGGIREYGFFGYLKNLVPPGLPLWLLPIMIPVEILGLLAKPFALCVRLFANMTAGHLVIFSLLALIQILGVSMAPVAIGFALFIHLLELLVAFLQAYIFTMLTALFIGMNAHPAH